MKCQECGNAVPSGSRFCGACGTPMHIRNGLGSAAADEVNSRVKTFLSQLAFAKFDEIRPGLHVGHKGSTHVEVRVVPLGQQIVVRSLSPVTMDTPITQDLLEFLLSENANLLFGAFGIGSRKEIVYTHTIMATSMDLHELGASVSSVLNMADKYDDQIVEKWGGKTAKQMALGNAMPLIKILMEAKKAAGGRPIPEPTASPRARRPEVQATISAESIRPRVAPTIAKPAGPDVSKAIKVTSVPQEYAYLARQKCSCGGGYTRNTQALLQINGLMYDQLAVTCSTCGNEEEFLFDINAFIGKR